MNQTDATHTQAAQDRLIRLPEVKSRTGLSQSHIYRLMQAKQFPLPGKQGHISTWSESEISEYVEQVKRTRTLH